MNLRLVKEIAKVNLIYAIPGNQLANYRKKQAKNHDTQIAKKIFSQQVLIGLLYMAYFGGFVGYLLPLSKLSGLFANLVGTFTLLTLAQAFIAFYNVFYDSKDLVAYRPYAFREAEVIVGKSTSVFMATIAGIAPIMAYFYVIAIQDGHFWYTIPLATLYLLGFLAVLALLIFTLVHFICQIPTFKKHKDLVSNIFIGFSLLLTVLVYLNLNGRNVFSGQGQVAAVTPIFESFYYMILQPLSSAALIGLVSWVAVGLALFFLVKTLVIPNFYDATVSVTTQTQSKKREKATSTHLLKNLRGYWLNQVKEGTILLQGLFMPNLLPVIFFITFMRGSMDRAFPLEVVTGQVQYLYLFVLIGLAVAFFSAPNTILSFAFSLERDNFDYLMALPLDKASYIKHKFALYFGLQSLLPGILLLALGFFVRLNLWNFLGLMTAWGASSFALSAFYYTYDYKNRQPNWTNITDLANRGKKFWRILILLAALVIFFLLMVSGTSFIAMSSRIIGVIIGVVAWALSIGASLVIGRILLYDLAKQVDQ